MIKKIFKRKPKTEEKLPSRITNDTVAEHREQVLAGGRKLKYPMQYTRRKLVRNTIVISAVALIALVTLVWLQLYVWRDTSDLAYRITKTVPLPVASIDGQYVRYSDYLLYHRSTLAGLQNQSGSDGTIDGDRVKFQQQRAMDQALEDAYARKIAKQYKIQVSDQKVEELMNLPRKEYGMTDSAYAAAVNDSLRWTLQEMRQATKNALLRQEAAFAVDDDASKLAKQAHEMVVAGKSLTEVSELLGTKVEYRSDVTVPRANSDGGLTAAAAKVGVGKVSGVTKILAGNGYYLIEHIGGDDKNINYSYIRVPLTVFAGSFAKLKNDKTQIFIDLK